MLCLPPEILEQIADTLWAPSGLTHSSSSSNEATARANLALRLVCTQTKDATLRPFARLFSSVSVCFNSKSLRRLHDVANHPRLGRGSHKAEHRIQRLVLVGRLRELRVQNMHSTIQGSFHRDPQLADFLDEVHAWMFGTQRSPRAGSEKARNAAVGYAKDLEEQERFDVSGENGNILASAITELLNLHTIEIQSPAVSCWGDGQREYPNSYFEKYDQCMDDEQRDQRPNCTTIALRRLSTAYEAVSRPIRIQAFHIRTPSDAPPDFRYHTTVHLHRVDLSPAFADILSHLERIYIASLPSALDLAIEDTRVWKATRTFETLLASDNLRVMILDVYTHTYVDRRQSLEDLLTDYLPPHKPWPNLREFRVVGWDALFPEHIAPSIAKHQSTLEHVEIANDGGTFGQGHVVHRDRQWDVLWEALSQCLKLEYLRVDIDRVGAQCLWQGRDVVEQRLASWVEGEQFSIGPRRCPCDQDCPGKRSPAAISGQQSVS